MTIRWHVTMEFDRGRRRLLPPASGCSSSTTRVSSSPAAGLAASSVTLLDEHAECLGFELLEDARSVKTGRGQVHQWFLLRHVGGSANRCAGGSLKPRRGGCVQADPQAESRRL
jgi:hypothetical protein